jgi:hypothetical protein
MPWEYRHAVEEPFGRGVRLAEVELQGVLVEFPHRDRLAADGEQIAERRRDLLIEISPEREHHVVGVERVPIGKPDSAPEIHSVPPAVRRDRPGPGQRGLGPLCLSVDVNQVRVHPAQNIPRGAFDGGDRVEGPRLGALHHDELPAGPARFGPDDQEIRAGRLPLKPRARGRHGGE